MTTTAEINPAQPAPETPAPSQRLTSVDALRGFDMFWIIGADSLVYALHEMTRNKTTDALAYQLDHADWEGFRFYDLIFPLFVFLVGVSLVFSLGKTVERFGRPEALKRVFRRSILLFVLGIFCYGGVASSWPDIRLVGVLQRIALAYCFAGLFFCFFKPRVLVGICAGLLLGYWALLALLPMRDIELSKSHLATVAEQSGNTNAAALFSKKGTPIKPGTPAWAAAEQMFYSTTNFVTGKYGKGYNVANHLDFQYLPGRHWDTFWDPEGWLSTIPAIATCLLGTFAGLLLQSKKFCDKWKLIYLVSFGVGAVIVGWLWNIEFPVIKKIWTSSYVLVAGGYSALFLAAFYLVVDVWKYQKWAQPFVWIGMNAITIYVGENILGGFGKIANRFVGGNVQKYFDAHVAQGFGELMSTIVGLLIAILFMRFLYKRKIFLRV
jgi:predicted acyltransferase